VTLQELKRADMKKWERLKDLQRLIGLPIQMHYDFSPEEVIEQSARVQDFFRRFPSPPYSVKAEPKPVFEVTHIRHRRHHATREEVIAFVEQLTPDPSHYTVSIWEGFPIEYSGNLILALERGLGEVKQGTHRDLTQGYATEGEQIYEVEFDLQDPFVSMSALPHPFSNILSESLHYMRVPKNATVPYETAHGYVCGYFEFIYHHELGFRFFDFNTVLMNNWAALAPLLHHQVFTDEISSQNTHILKGRSAYPGVREGRAAVVCGPEDMHLVQKGDILIAPITTTEYVPILNKVEAIACAWGGITSHPAIIARELKIPTIVGVKGLIDCVKTGDYIRVDADQGTITTFS
jgi:phosphohistidine swiveling domain-containing protein